MTIRTFEEWIDISEALAFAGNSLLAPMSQTGPIGLDPSFWKRFPDFNDADVAAAIDACMAYALEARAYSDKGSDAIQRASVEYTKLFVGPPRPAAAPWETMYRSAGSTTGFGEAAFAMQALLRDAGLEVSNDNNQYADHIGIELLYASALCQRVAEARANGIDDDILPKDANRIVSFAKDHPLGWLDDLVGKVEQTEPEGYIIRILRLGRALLRII